MLIDKAGGIGGTWYWNRYPGVMCDVESYIYMPMLEELNYVPTTRYAFGDEIRRHLDAIATKYGLVDDALFHTGVETSEWDEDTSRWIIRTDRGDEIRARYLIMAPGILNLMKLPAIPGMDEFEGTAFHTARWDYEYTGGSPGRPAPHQARRQGRRRRRRGRERHPGGAAARRVGEARLRVPAHAVGHRRARQPPDRRRVRRAAPCRGGSASGWRTSAR